MTENAKLNAAIAAVQAELPQITKGETGEVTGVTKDGKPYRYTYKYADLADVSHAVMPKLGENGLAFIAKPTLTEAGQFALAYSLLHVSGEREDGLYPLPATGTPQQIGSAITYARRYCLCAVTGVAPRGDDDDAASGNTPQQYDRPQSAGEAFENAAPAPGGRRVIRPEDMDKPANGNGTVSSPAQAAKPAATGEIDERAQRGADEAAAALTEAEVKTIYAVAKEAGDLPKLIRNPATGGTGTFGQYLNWRGGVLRKAERAFADLKVVAQAAGLSDKELAAEVTKQTGRDIEAASAEDFEKVTAVLAPLAATGVPA